ncbi:MAG: HypC/HybG/HupF family hydrogenase formation chaperone [Parcubacteria group bacterium]|jgi:hydrogenase maturation factor
MCLTIPKKVVEITGDEVVVELPNGDRQTVKSIVDLGVGDFCLTQQNVAIYKLDQKEAEEVLGLFQNREGNNNGQ